MEIKRGIKGYGKLLTDKDGKIVCHICGRSFHDLSKHVKHTHKLSATEYREQFGLNATQSLISQESKSKRRDAVLSHPELIEQLVENGKSYQWEKGVKHKGKKKQLQWRLSQIGKSYADGKWEDRVEFIRAIGKSKLAHKIRYKNWKPLTQKERLKKGLEKARRGMLILKLLERCIAGTITNEELYRDYPEDVVEAVLKKELKWLKENE